MNYGTTDDYTCLIIKLLWSIGEQIFGMQFFYPKVYSLLRIKVFLKIIPYVKQDFGTKKEIILVLLLFCAFVWQRREQVYAIFLVNDLD